MKSEEVKTPVTSSIPTVAAQKGTSKVATSSTRESKLKSALTGIKKPREKSKPAMSATHASQMAKELGPPPTTAFNAYLVKSIRDNSNYYFRHPECVEGVLGKEKDKLINR